jgi:hypothetical protein
MKLRKQTIFLSVAVSPGAVSGRHPRLVLRG